MAQKNVGMREEQRRRRVARLIQFKTADCRGDLSWVTSVGAAAGDHSLLQAMQHSHSPPSLWTHAYKLQPSGAIDTNAVSNRRSMHH